MSDTTPPSYEWIDKHNARQDTLDRATQDRGSLWKYAPGIVYTGAIVLLSVVLGTEISKLFAGQSSLLQSIGWGCVSVVGMSAIASFYGKGDVYKSQKQQRLGMFFWVLELMALTVGLIVSIADAFGFSGILVDVARFAGFMSVVVAAFGWGVVRWAGPDWKVTAQKNRTDADLAVKLAQLDAQYQLSDEVIALRMETARLRAERDAVIDHQRTVSTRVVKQLVQPQMATMNVDSGNATLEPEPVMVVKSNNGNGKHPKE